MSHCKLLLYKGVLTVQPHPLSEERLSRQQAFAASCATLPLCSKLLCCKIWILRLQLCCFAINLGPSRVSFPVPFELSTSHKCSLCFHLGFAMTTALTLAVSNQRCDRFARRSIPTRIVTQVASSSSTAVCSTIVLNRPASYSGHQPHATRSFTPIVQLQS